MLENRTYLGSIEEVEVYFCNELENNQVAVFHNPRVLNPDNYYFIPFSNLQSCKEFNSKTTRELKQETITIIVGKSKDIEFYKQFYILYYINFL